MKSETVDTHRLDQYYSAIYRKYDLINRIFTLGNDEKWRRITAKECLKSNPVDVIDVCCGTGDLGIKISQLAKSKIRVTGFDINRQMLDLAESKTKKLSIDNIRFMMGDAAEMPFGDESFDAMTIGFGFRNLTFKNPRADIHLHEMNRVLRKGGKLYILESSVPSNKFIRFFYTTYLNTILIPLGTLISGNRRAYTYLARSSANFFKVEEIRQILTNHGFKIQDVNVFFFGASSLIIADKE
jgi:demethylmenaquinone methyltransferase/2-methoxy-6-polyprenyl-1,4-benzoquinol methylase